MKNLTGVKQFKALTSIPAAALPGNDAQKNVLVKQRSLPARESLKASR